MILCKIITRPQSHAWYEQCVLLGYIKKKLTLSFFDIITRDVQSIEINIKTNFIWDRLEYVLINAQRVCSQRYLCFFT